jgi:AraC-like DNA-binding protein
MDLQQVAREALQLLPWQDEASPQSAQPMPGLTLSRHHGRNTFEATLYQPVVCLIVQGGKETTFARHNVAVGAGDVMLISHALPVISHVTEAPYLSLMLDLEIGTLRSLYDEVAETRLEPTRVRSVEVHRADPQLIEALRRYLTLTASATDAKVLGPLIVKEIHYRLLMAPFGGMLRSLVRYDSPASAVTRAIAHIRGDFQRSIAVPELAQQVGMSVSAFHKHFKAVTYSTPLQYQKDLRLLEARRLLVIGGASVSTAAYEVGYESPSQFSREYARKFGVPPSHDLANASDQYVMQE